MSTFAERRALLTGAFPRGAPGPADVPADDSPGGASPGLKKALTSGSIPAVPPAQRAEFVFPEPPEGPPPFDRRKRVYPSKLPTGTLGCPDFHAFVQGGGA